MPASAWFRPLVIGAGIAFLAGGLGLLLNQPRLAPVALFIGELLTILAAIVWNTPKLPLFSETRPIGAAADQTTSDVVTAASSDDIPESKASSAPSSQGDAL